MKLDAWWRARRRREKLMITAGAAATLMACGDALLTQPLAKRLHRAEAQNRQLSSQIVAQATPSSDTSAQRGQETALRERLERLRSSAQAQRARVADSARLPETLRAITSTVGSARLLELDLSGDSDAGAVSPAAAGATKPAPADTRARLHRLPITLKVAGSWQELQLLLTQIERHASALQWTALTLDNTEWPSIQLTLKAHVLSTEPRWGAAGATSS